MILEEFALLASDTVRTKAYLQAMICEEKLPAICIVYSDNISKMQNEAKQYRNDTGKTEYFNTQIPILYSLHSANIPYVLVEEKDINSEQIKTILQETQQKYFIYSGYGGYILKTHLFQMDKKFIHVHAGILPQYRGSTTVYYSFLQEKGFGATAIFLSEGIDEGEIITYDMFEVPDKPVNVDYVYEPYMRSRVLIKAIDQYLKGGFCSDIQNSEGAETYFIIHPVLKHIAMLGMEKEWEKNNYETSNIYTTSRNC